MMGINTVGYYSYNRVIIYGSLASLFIFLLEGGVHLHYLSPTLYFSFKFSILSLPSFEDLPFSASTLGEEDFIHLPAVLLLIKPYVKKLKVKVLLGNSFSICIITCCKRKSKERNQRKETNDSIHSHEAPPTPIWLAVTDLGCSGENRNSLCCKGKYKV
ncbi:unnamed protein product [Rangifer tarandus platyrhynchus]|uniref:Uncharacterized protein n=2 Tax=Rangifer tarandus platyrhynchus TaxID=3082113 RepID=A0ABN8YND1_RANTA|nr:unnamed protein product [Rangifer tarandus platyrhynchus]